MPSSGRLSYLISYFIFYCITCFHCFVTFFSIFNCIRMDGAFSAPTHFFIIMVAPTCATLPLVYYGFSDTNDFCVFFLLNPIFFIYFAAMLDMITFFVLSFLFTIGVLGVLYRIIISIIDHWKSNNRL